MLKMILIPKSSNAKTGNIIQSYSSRSTCPKRCPLKNNGCYADSYHTSRQWDRCDDPEDNRYIKDGNELGFALLAATAEKMRKGATDVLFRHNVAGDIAYPDSNMIDKERLEAITEACKRVNSVVGGALKGYTYTHCAIAMQNVKAVRKASEGGFLVNFSCETVEEVREIKALECDAVLASADVEASIEALKAEGLKAVQCPAQTKENVSCETCKLCSRKREAVVIFAIHGNGAKKARKVIMMKQGSK